MKPLRSLVCLLLALPLFSQAIDAKLTLAPQGADEAKLGYYPVPIPLSTQKPGGIRKEPVYASAPKYGTFKLGNGPRSTYVFALDEPEGGTYKIYIDRNQNGDLTDDGDGAWNKRSDTNGRVMYGVLNVPLRASYGAGEKESSSAEYTLGFYRFVNHANVFCYRRSARTGTLALGGKTHRMILAENDADALFSKTVTEAKDLSKTRPLWLLVDLTDDGTYASKPIDIRGPFSLEDKVYEAKVSSDGASFTLQPTDKPILVAPKVERKPLLTAGTMAPDFTFPKWGGGDVKLSDYRGKVVILDFWATWCGPCQKSMPHIQKVTQALQGKAVVVLALCTWDEQEAYTAWAKEKAKEFRFQMGFDPAGKKSAESIAEKLYNVSGIPTTYLIDAQGRIIEGIVGYKEGDDRIEAALRKAGIPIP